MLDGVMLLWFSLTALAVLFVAIDIQRTPESPVLKWGFVLLTAYTGPIGAFLYVLGCREPLPGLHERYVATRWRQVLGSTMHCVAGDGVGILAGAAIASVLKLPGVWDVALEYLLGFAFGWMIFQALFMRGEAGGSYKAALTNTFFPELLSMNCLMAGMVPTMMVSMAYIPGAHEPTGPAFWFVMSMALLVGFVVAYPMNWWLVGRHMKHGMMTVRGRDDAATPSAATSTGRKFPFHGKASGHSQSETSPVSLVTLAGMTTLSLAIFAAGLALTARLGGFS